MKGWLDGAFLSSRSYSCRGGLADARRDLDRIPDSLEAEAEASGLVKLTKRDPEVS